MNPADQAAIEQAKFNADQARQDASGLMKSATENAKLFTEQADQRLASGMAILGKTGNLGDTLNPLPSSGIDIGASDITGDLKKQAADLQKQLDATPQTIAQTSHVGGPNGYDQTTETVNPDYKSLQDKLSAINDQISTLGQSSGVSDIQNPDMLGKATGSDLLTMVTTRDQMERDKRTLMRNAQSEALKALQAGKNYDKMADYATRAASWNTWSTILGVGIKVGTTIAGIK